jgi:hypothetical protein
VQLSLRAVIVGTADGIVVDDHDDIVLSVKPLRNDSLATRRRA